MNTRGLLGALPLIGMVLAAACTGASPVSTDGPSDPESLAPESLAPQNHASSWIGEYVGAGSGSVMGTSVTFDQARLVIALDADSVRSERCPGCVTVTLDSLFTIVNLSPRDPIRLVLTVSYDGYRRTLHLDRFSGGGRTANILTGRLVLEALNGTGDAGDITYLLELRT